MSNSAVSANHIVDSPEGRGNNDMGVPIHDMIISLMSLSEQLAEEIASQLRKQGVRDLKPTWAITLFRMGDQAWRGVDLSDIWLGICSITYPIKKMSSLGLLSIERDPTDRRSILIRRTEKGRDVAAIVDGILRSQGDMLLSNVAMNFSAREQRKEIYPILSYLAGKPGRHRVGL